MPFATARWTKFIYMPAYQAIRMLVITAKHHLIFILMKQFIKRFKIFCSASFPDKNFHSIL